MAFAQNTKKVAILEVVDKEGTLSYSHKLLLRSSLAKAVSNTAGYEAYDRTDIDAIMSEHDFQRTGLVNGDQIKRLGEMAGVAYILVPEGAMMGEENMFITAKLLNVETAKVEMTDNQMVGVSPLELQKGCETLANVLFGKKDNQSITQIGISDSYYNIGAQSAMLFDGSITKIDSKHYSYKGNTMNKKAYEAFLRYKCPQAYKQYNVGRKLKAGGWSCIGVGGTFIVLGVALLAVATAETEAAGAAFLSIGAITAATSVPLLTIGYIKQKKSVDTYNYQCVAPITFNVTAGQNGLGLAMNF